MVVIITVIRVLAVQIKFCLKAVRVSACHDNALTPSLHLYLSWVQEYPMLILDCTIERYINYRCILESHYLKSHVETLHIYSSTNFEVATPPRFSARGVIEAIFADEDSNDQYIDCRSKIAICPDSENEENSDIDISEQLQRLEIERQQQEATAADTGSCIY